MEYMFINYLLNMKVCISKRPKTRQQVNYECHFDDKPAKFVNITL